MINKPFLALCADRAKMPKSHPTSGAPEDWFSVDNLARFNISSLSFDFFVNWSTSPVGLTKEFWLKILISPQSTLKEVIDNFSIEFFKLYNRDILKDILTNFRNSDLKLYAIVYNDESDFNNSETEIGKINIFLNSEGEISFEPSIISFGLLKNQIKDNSGGAVKMGSKGLIYGTSKMECFLSNTDSLYPGDADLVLLRENQIVAILEYKKHTLDLPIEKQTLGNYYPKPDARKYDRLAVLKDFLGGGIEIPLINIYYPTLPNITQGKIEIICGKFQNFKIVDSILFDLPTNNNIEQQLPICELLVSILNKNYCK